MDKNIKAFSYAITGNPDEADYKYHYSDDIKKVLLNTYRKVHKKKIRNPQALLKLIERYPNVPAFKNYLVVNYQLHGKNEKARSANHWLVKEHPDYLFGKLNLCAEYLEDDRLDEIPKVLGQALDLKDLYPEREVFFIQEFTSFLNISCRYLIADNALEAAESRIEAATGILGDDHEVIQILNIKLSEAWSKRNIEKYKTALAKRELAQDELPQKDYDAIQTTEPPIFNHPEILELYKNGLAIEKSILDKILALPKVTLLEDLENVLLDALQRFDYFNEKLEEEEGWEKNGSFPLHAIALLKQLDAKEKLPIIISHLSEKEELTSFWYEDHLYETLWHFIYHLSHDDLSNLKQFQKDRTINSRAKVIIQQAVTQIAYHQPTRREEVENWYIELLEFCIENIEDSLRCDIEVVTNIVVELCGLGAQKSLPLIKKCYDLDLIEIYACGSYDNVAEDIFKPLKDDFRKIEIYDHIFDHYQDIVSTWHGYSGAEETEAELLAEIARKEKKLEELNAKLEFQRKVLKEKEEENERLNFSNNNSTLQPKVGRNEPCPCGSGKKYKKCCY